MRGYSTFHGRVEGGGGGTLAGAIFKDSNIRDVYDKKVEVITLREYQEIEISPISSPFSP